MTKKRHEIAVVADLPGDLREALAERFDLVEEPLEGARAKPGGELSPRHVAIATRALVGVPQELLDRLPDLRLVLSLGAGLDRIDPAKLAARDIHLAYTPDQFTEDVADFALGLIFAGGRQIVQADRFARSGAWLQGRFPVSRRVSARRVGIVGMGRIGRRLAEKCASLGMPVAYCGRSPHPDLPYAYCANVKTLAAESDVLVLACAFNEQTRGMVDHEVLKALGPDGLLVNVARGAVVDEEALLSALADKTLGGAALDVFCSEPGFDERFVALENVITTPHIASFTLEARQAVIDHLVGEAMRYFGMVNDD